MTSFQAAWFRHFWVIAETRLAVKPGALELLDTPDKFKYQAVDYENARKAAPARRGDVMADNLAPTPETIRDDNVSRTNRDCFGTGHRG